MRKVTCVSVLVCSRWRSEEDIDNGPDQLVSPFEHLALSGQPVRYPGPDGKNVYASHMGGAVFVFFAVLFWCTTLYLFC